MIDHVIEYTWLNWLKIILIIWVGTCLVKLEVTVCSSIDQIGGSQRKDRPLLPSDENQHRQIFIPHYFLQTIKKEKIMFYIAHLAKVDIWSPCTTSVETNKPSEHSELNQSLQVIRTELFGFKLISKLIWTKHNLQTSIQNRIPAEQQIEPNVW